MSRQDRRKARATIGLEALEGRRLLSTMDELPLDELMSTTSVAVARAGTTVPLQGTARGSVTPKASQITDVGDVVNLRGSGRLQGFGPAKIQGTLQGTGHIIPPGHVVGNLTLANGKGSLTLRLQGTADVGAGTPPGSGTFAYSVVKGTGNFRHAVGEGTVDLAVAGKSFTASFHATPNVYY